MRLPARINTVTAQRQITLTHLLHQTCKRRVLLHDDDDNREQQQHKPQTTGATSTTPCGHAQRQPRGATHTHTTHTAPHSLPLQTTQGFDRRRPTTQYVPVTWNLLSGMARKASAMAADASLTSSASAAASTAAAAASSSTAGSESGYKHKNDMDRNKQRRHQP